MFGGRYRPDDISDAAAGARLARAGPGPRLRGSRTRHGSRLARGLRRWTRCMQPPATPGLRVRPTVLDSAPRISGAGRCRRRTRDRSHRGRSRRRHWPMGIGDVFARRGLRLFGPTAAAAELEASKVFAKEFCLRHHDPNRRGRDRHNGRGRRARGAATSVFRSCSRPMAWPPAKGCSSSIPDRTRSGHGRSLRQPKVRLGRRPRAGGGVSRRRRSLVHGDQRWHRGRAVCHLPRLQARRRWRLRPEHRRDGFTLSGLRPLGRASR